MTRKSIFLNLFISLVVFSSGILLYDQYVLPHKKKIYYVIDAEKLLGDPRDYIAKLVERGATAEEHKAYRKSYAERIAEIDAYLNNLSQRYGIVIFNKKAIYGSNNVQVVDLTKRVLDVVEK